MQARVRPCICALAVNTLGMPIRSTPRQARILIASHTVAHRPPVHPSVLRAGLTPHSGPSGSILLGDSDEHSYTEIHITEFKGAASVAAIHIEASVAAARAALLAQPGVSLVTLTGGRSAAFAGMPTFEETGGATPPVHMGPPRLATDCTSLTRTRTRTRAHAHAHAHVL